MDHVFNDKDRGYIRVWRDNGFQPTYTDGFSPIFNVSSNQPQMALQVSESHAFGPTAVNQFSGSTLFYSAAFANSDPTAPTAALPFPISFAGSFFGYPQILLGNVNSTVGGASWDFNQGRRVWQYQILDDFSKVSGAHTFRAGFSWLHDNVTELGFGEQLNGWLTINSLMDFYQGFGASSTFAQRFPSATEQPFTFNTFGGYVADDWKVKDNLTVSLNLRLENYSNPACAHNCFARLGYTFTGAPGNLNQPYNQAILFNQHNAYPDTQAVVWEPRLGIAWRPARSHKLHQCGEHALFLRNLLSHGRHRDRLRKRRTQQFPRTKLFRYGSGALQGSEAHRACPICVRRASFQCVESSELRPARGGCLKPAVWSERKTSGTSHQHFGSICWWERLAAVCRNKRGAALLAAEG